MQDYRLYLMDRTGHVVTALELDCADDDEAVARADRERRDQPAELWQRARRLFTFEAPNK
jgi:hypothetical protein